MRISNITLHNFRSVAHGSFTLNDYSILIGANNSGKTNIMDALRVFYEKGVKYEEARDFPKFKTADSESWIDIIFVLSNDEYVNLKDEYKQPNNCVKVRKFLKTSEKGSDGKLKQGIYAYIKDKVSDEHFYGAKNVQQGKLGEVIYIPAVTRLDEHTKMSGPSALRDLLNDILKKLVKSSASFKALTDGFEVFAKNFKGEQTTDGKSLNGLEQDINTEIQEWDAEFELNINPVSDADIVKNLVSFKIIDKALADQKLEAGQFGQGFQRHLIFTLIRVAAKYQPAITTGTKKEFSPTLTLLLFEEPEAFLHPMQQSVMCRSLQVIAKQQGNQVFVSSHSPNFVSHNADDIPGIIRLCREKGVTIVGQIDKDALAKIFIDNQKINEILKNFKEKAHEDDLKEEMEALKYFLWIDPERSGMFFAAHVLLVEGPTEKTLINYLFDIDKLQQPKGGMYVLDCLGKFNIHRFMNLLGPLNVDHSILCDEDGGKPPHAEIKKLIEATRNSRTKKIDSFPVDIEKFLGIEPTKQHRKPQHVLLKWKDGSVKKNEMEAFISKVGSFL